MSLETIEMYCPNKEGGSSCNCGEDRYAKREDMEYNLNRFRERYLQEKLERERLMQETRAHNCS